jgi:hypothetical protein
MFEELYLQATQTLVRLLLSMLCGMVVAGIVWTRRKG